MSIASLLQSIFSYVSPTLLILLYKNAILFQGKSRYFLGKKQVLFGKKVGTFRGKSRYFSGGKQVVFEYSDKQRIAFTT